MISAIIAFKEEYFQGAIEHAQQALTYYQLYLEVPQKSNTFIEYVLAQAYFATGQLDKASKATDAFFDLASEEEATSTIYKEMDGLRTKLNIPFAEAEAIL